MYQVDVCSPLPHQILPVNLSLVVPALVDLLPSTLFLHPQSSPHRCCPATTEIKKIQIRNRKYYQYLDINE